MAWANKYCVSMDKRIKLLETELSKYQPVMPKSVDSSTADGWQPCIKKEPNTSPIDEELEESKIFKLNIRKNNTLSSHDWFTKNQHFL